MKGMPMSRQMNAHAVRRFNEAMEFAIWLQALRRQLLPASLVLPLNLIPTR